MKIRPLGNRIVVKQDAPKMTSTNGIMLVSSAIDAANIGVVIAAGPGRHLDNGEFIPNSVSVGDRILFNKQSAEEIEVDKEKALIMTEDAIMGILN
jgi:chaperonin GroES